MFALPPENLRLTTDPARLPFESTADLARPTSPVGQDRAMRALAFGAGMAQPGYNIFVGGLADCGKHTSIRLALEQIASKLQTPGDIVFVHNFLQPARPRAIKFGAGEGAVFRGQMLALVDNLKKALAQLFASKPYLERRRMLEDEYHRTADETATHIRNAAETRGLALVEHDRGAFDFEPCKDGLIVPAQQLRALPRPERDRISNATGSLRQVLERATDVLENLRLSTLSRIGDLDAEMGRDVVRECLRTLQQRYVNHRQAQSYLEEVLQDLLGQIEQLQALVRGEADGRKASYHHYEVNVAVDHAKTTGAPVVTMMQVSRTQLAGRVEHLPALSVAAAECMLVRPGALHQANGGFLLIDAVELFRVPGAWETLKLALRSRQISMDSQSELDRIHSDLLKPDPVALDVKVVLFGEAWAYQRLCQYDRDFSGLFKVQAEFSAAAPRDDHHCEALLATLAVIARDSGLKQMDRSGAARLIDEASRQTGDAEKISVRVGRLADLVREADHFATRNDHTLVTADDIVQAILAKDDRLSRIKALDYELIQRGIVFIDTDGVKSGQVNGLTVLNVAGHVFGVPARITAQAHPGNGSVTDIERVSEFGGPSHTKGVHILSGYLNGNYSNGRPLSVSASVAFEQFYGRIDGDSASAGELIAILSAIAQVPLRQGIAITGSIDQHGLMQPIGSANEKIEGFFDVCAARGFAPGQGVIIPRANVTSLMLRDDVVDAVRARRFSIYGARTINDAIEILSGMKAGARHKGIFPRDSFNRRVDDRLIDFARPRIVKPIRLDGRRLF